MSKANQMVLTTATKVIAILFALLISTFTGFSSYVLITRAEYATENRTMIKKQVETHKKDFHEITDKYVKISAHNKDIDRMDQRITRKHRGNYAGPQR